MTDSQNVNISEAAIPSPWSQEITGCGKIRLSCGVPSGPGRNLIIGVGVVFCVLGLLGMGWLLTVDPPQSIEGYLYFLMPAGIVLCGLFCFDVAFFAKSRYQIGETGISIQRTSLFRRQRFAVPRASVVGIWQKYTPPDPMAPSSTPGDWVTYLVCDRSDGQEVGQFPLDGVHTADEAVWLAGLLSRWAGVPVKRTFAPNVDEASAGPLPVLPPVGG